MTSSLNPSDGWGKDEAFGIRDRGERRVGDPLDLIQLPGQGSAKAQNWRLLFQCFDLPFIDSRGVKTTLPRLGAQGTSWLSIWSKSSIFLWPGLTSKGFCSLFFIPAIEILALLPNSGFLSPCSFSLLSVSIVPLFVLLEFVLFHRFPASLLLVIHRFLAKKQVDALLISNNIYIYTELKLLAIS